MTPLRDVAKSIFLQSLEDCSVARAMARHVSVQDGQLHLGGEQSALRDVKRLRILAAGKAASTMLTALLQRLHPPPVRDVAGVCIAPKPPEVLPANFPYFRGGHPLPNEASLAGARAAVELLRAIPAAQNSNTLCIFLLSGGASAMMELPLDPAIGLADTAAFHGALVGSGASITEINCVRKHFSTVKGGRLAAMAANSPRWSIFVSDVPAGHEDAIGSGPTLTDTSTLEECREILARYRLLPQFPASVRRYFQTADLPETPREPQSNGRTCVLLHSDDLAEAAARRARDLGWMPVIDHTSDEWAYDRAADYLLTRLRGLRRQSPRVCLIAGGEVLVRLPANPSTGGIGRGGRNQQFALYAATRLTTEDAGVAVLSAGSDGIDGNSPAAGAVVDDKFLRTPESWTHAEEALSAFNAYPFLVATGAALILGSTGNNLRDLRMLIAGENATIP